MPDTVVKTKPYDAAELLHTPEQMAAYLEVCLEEPTDAKTVAGALGDIARAKKMMAEISKKTGLGRESLYKSLSGDCSPSLDTILKVIHALGLEIKVVPAAKSQD